ncbi:MAG: VWA domain-containing protein [Pyrinomonadaceae bacterium]
MKNAFLSVLFIALLAISSFSQNKPPTPVIDDDDVVKISTNLIQVDVSVMDEDGKQVTDLKPGDFEIYEDNKQREISNFSYTFVTTPMKGKNDQAAARKQNQSEMMKNLPPMPNSLKPNQVRRTIALVVDDLGIAFAGSKFVKDSLKRFVNEQMQPNDLVAIIRASGGSGVFQQFTSDKRLLLASIDKIKPNLTKIDSFAPLTNASGLASNQKYEAQMNARYALGAIGAMNYLIKSMGQLPGRKTIILFSEGFMFREKPLRPNSSGRDDVETDFARIISADSEIRQIYSEIGGASKVLTESANRAGIVINTIDARGLTEPSANASDGTFEEGQTSSGFSRSAEAVNASVAARRERLFDSQSSLLYLAKETGGRAFFNNGFTTAIQKSIDDQNGYYLIGYQPDEETFDPEKRKFNKFEIRVKNRPNLTVRYRSGFFGITNDKLPVKTGATAGEELSQALFSPFDVNGIDLELTPIFSNAGKLGGNSVNALLHIKGEDLNFLQETNGTRKGQFEILAVTLDAGGKTIDRVAKAYSLNLNQENYQKLVAKGLVYMMNIPIKNPGAYQLKVAFRDINNGKIGSSSQFLDVPNVNKGRLYLSGILLQAFTPQELQMRMQKVNAVSNQTSEAFKIQSDTANRRFRRGTNLNFGYEIYGAKTNSNNEARLQSQVKLFSENQLIFESQKESILLRGEKHKSESLITLGNDLKPGYYFLQVLVTDESAKDKKQTATQWISFEVIN